MNIYDSIKRKNEFNMWHITYFYANAFNKPIIFSDVSMKFDTNNGIKIAKRIKFQLRQTCIDYVLMCYIYGLHKDDKNICSVLW